MLDSQNDRADRNESVMILEKQNLHSKQNCKTNCNEPIKGRGKEVNSKYMQYYRALSNRREFTKK